MAELELCRKMTALMLSPEAPFPLTGGGALRTASLLHYLGPRYDVDLIVFRQPGAPDPSHALPHGLIRSLTVIDLPENGRDVAARAFRNASRVIRRISPLVDRFAGFGAEIARALEGRSYDLGIIEHSWAAPYLDQLAPHCHRTVLNLHNVESLLHDRCAQTEPAPLAFAHPVCRDAARELERAHFPRFSLVLATSPHDADLARSIAPKATVAVYPNALPAIPLPAQADDEALVFSGNMQYHPNIAAVRFFRGAGWPLLLAHPPAPVVWRRV